MASVTTSAGMPNLTATYYGGSSLGKKRKLPKSSKSRNKVAKTLGEFKRGSLHSGSKKGPVVKNRKQAIAIAISQARKEK